MYYFNGSIKFPDEIRMRSVCRKKYLNNLNLSQRKIAFKSPAVLVVMLLHRTLSNVEILDINHFIELPNHLPSCRDSEIYGHILFILSALASFARHVTAERHKETQE